MLRSAPVRRGRLVPLFALAGLATLVALGLHAAFRMSLSSAGTTPVRVSGLSLVFAILCLTVPAAMLAVAARPAAWFAHWVAGAVIGLGVWFAFGALSPSLALAMAVGAAVALPVRYIGHRVVRVAALLIPGPFTWMVAGTGAFAGLGVPTLVVVAASPLYLVLVDLLTWDGPRIVMRQLGRSALPGRMDRAEARRFERQVEWQSWSVLGLLAGLALVVLWWGGGRAPYVSAHTLVPTQIDATATWLDVNGAYKVDWTRTQNTRGQASTTRVFEAGNRTVRISATNTGNPLLAEMYFDAAYGITSSVRLEPLNALATPTVVRADVVTTERLDCTRESEPNVCAEFTYTAYVDQYLIEVVMTKPRQLKVGQLSPIVDGVLDQVGERLAP